MAVQKSITHPFFAQDASGNLLPFPAVENDAGDIAQLIALPFREAAQLWLASRKGHLAPRTYLDYGNYIRTLAKFFGKIKLPEITGDQVRSYQRFRSRTAGPGLINKECGVLLQIRKRIGMPLTDYQQLAVPKDYESPGRALTGPEEAKLEEVFREAAAHPLWDVAALASLLSMKCGAGPGEILSLRLKNICLKPAEILIPRAGAKRERRERLISLNEPAAWALEKLVLRATNKCRCSHPDHYLIPRRNVDHTYDPSQPAMGWREGLRQLLAIAGIRVRRYDFRHHAVSRALSSPTVPLEGAKEYFGWISPKMIRRYYHANLVTLKVVAAAIDSKPSSPSADCPPKKKASRGVESETTKTGGHIAN